MAASQEVLENDELDDIEGVGEECLGEYLAEDGYTSSSIYLSFVENRISVAPPIIKKPKSSSDIISSVIPSFQSSSSLRSTYPAASWPSDVSKSDTYLQSSGGVFEDTTNSEFDPSSEPDQEVEILETEKPIRLTKTEIPKTHQIEKEKPKKRIKGSKCRRIPFLNEILWDVLNQLPSTKIHYVEKLKVSIDKSKMSESNLNSTVKLTIPEDNFAGKFTLNVEDLTNELFVESCCCFKDDDFTNGTQLFSKLTKDLQLIEEKRIEFQYNNIERKEKSLHVFMEIDNYIAYRSTKVDEIEQTYRGCISLNFQNDFVLDGCLFGMMRHFISVNYSGCFQCYSITISGRVCRQVFCIDEKKSMEINQQMVEVILLRKSTYDYATKRKIEMTETYFLPTGAMVYHTWKYSPYIVHIDPMLLFHEKKLSPCMELTWKSDCILYSLFEFKKEYYHCLLQKYLNSYPEVIELLNDYIISLFHEKPKSVVKFTCNFFEHA